MKTNFKSGNTITWEDIENLLKEMQNKKNSGETDEEQLSYFKEKAIRHLDKIQKEENKNVIPFPELKKDEIITDEKYNDDKLFDIGKKITLHPSLMYDNNEPLKLLQYYMYDYAIWHMFSEMRSVYINNSNVSLYLSEEEIEHLQYIESFDHRLLQRSYYIMAAIFRHDVYEGNIADELFDEDKIKIKLLFENEYLDTKFLNNIEQNHWILAYKWHKYINTFVRNNYPLVRELIFAIKKFNGNSEDKRKSWEAVECAINYLKDKYKNIPWKEK